MGSPYSVSITDGVGTAAIVQGDYDVTALVDCYNVATINPNEITIDATGAYNFAISAAGTMTLHVSVEGTAIGTDIDGAKFIRCNDVGTTDYGVEVTSDVDGEAVFSYLPYSDEDDPNVYYRQTCSDGDHDFATAVKTQVMSNQTYLVEIANPVPSTKTINLTDAHYSPLTIAAGTVILTEQE